MIVVVRDLPSYQDEHGAEASRVHKEARPRAVDNLPTWDSLIHLAQTRGARIRTRYYHIADRLCRFTGPTCLRRVV